MSVRVSASSRNEPRSDCSVSSRASTTATSVSAAIAAMCRYSPASLLPRPSISTAPSSRPPEEIGTSSLIVLGRLRAPAGQARAHVALVVLPPLHRSAEPRHDHRDRRPGVGGGDLGNPLEPVTGQHRAHHLEVGRAGGRSLDRRIHGLSGSCR